MAAAKEKVQQLFGELFEEQPPPRRRKAKKRR
jgi:hypothetical protein